MASNVAGSSGAKMAAVEVEFQMSPQRKSPRRTEGF
jgi:hypothetical protein